MGGGGGRGDRIVGDAVPQPMYGTWPGLDSDEALFGAPGPDLAAAMQALADPDTGSWPTGSEPSGSSPEPWAQVIHAVVAGRRLSGWVLWAQLSMVARWLTAWRAAPPVSNTSDPDRCEPADPALTQRLNEEIGRVHRRLGGQLSAFWQGQAAAMAPDLVAAELGLATGLSGLMADRHVSVADALFLQDRLPRLRRLLRAGWVDWPKLSAFVHDTDGLDLVVAHAVERIILGDLEPDETLDVLADLSQPGLGLPPIASMTLPQLRAAIAAAIAAIDAEAAARRGKEARAARRVRCRANLDGTGTLTADLTVEAAAAVWNGLTEAAKAARAAGDPRSLDQLRADALVAKTTGAPLPAPLPGDTWDVPDPDVTGPAANLGDIHTSGDPDDLVRHAAVAAAAAATETPATETTSTETTAATDAAGVAGLARYAPDAQAADDGAAVEGGACHACGQETGAARRQRAGAALSVSLTLPLSTYLGLADDPGELDGCGPVAAGLARQIIRDTARSHRHGLAGITWRCVVTDDEHGTVLGVGSPLHMPKHDPPPRLADLVRTSEPTCCFPGCRTRARDCDLDHRIPYDPDDPTGDRGGGATCSCNLQALCRKHHRLKTAGLIHVRAMSPGEEPGIVRGTLEFATSTGLRYHRTPTRATPAAADLEDPLIATAVAHAHLRAAQTAADGARMDAHNAIRARDKAAGRAGIRETGDSELDAEDRAWRRSQADGTRHRIASGAARVGRTPAVPSEPPF
jgi:hypothetical protein